MAVKKVEGNGICLAECRVFCQTDVGVNNIIYLFKIR